MRLWQIQCRCGRLSQIPDATLQDIKGDLIESPKGNAFVDFACPGCGLAIRYLISNLPSRDIPEPAHYTQHLLHKFLECVKQNCSSHATVHTMSADGTLDDPAIPVADWTVSEITCFRAHPVRVPLKEIAKIGEETEEI